MATPTVDVFPGIRATQPTETMPVAAGGNGSSDEDKDRPEPPTAAIVPAPQSSAVGMIGRFVPIVSWLPRYQWSSFPADAVAGITIWGLLIPEMIAYAGLAGLPPEAGLYTLLASLVVYAVFGTSRQLVVAGTSASAVLVLSTVTALGPHDAKTYATLASGFIVLTGLIFVAAGLLKLGFIAEFLSRPVMAGFVFGLAIFVTVSQLPKLFGLKKGDGDTIRQLAHVLANLGNTSLTTFAVGATALIMLFALERYLPRIPGGLVVLVSGIAIERGGGPLTSRRRNRRQDPNRVAVSHHTTSPGVPAVGPAAQRLGHDAGHLQRGARSGPDLRRQARLPDRLEPRDDRPGPGQYRLRLPRRPGLRRQLVADRGQRRSGSPFGAVGSRRRRLQPGHGGRPHPAVQRSPRGGARRPDHPRRVAPDEGRRDATLLPAGSPRNSGWGC